MKQWEVTIKTNAYTFVYKSDQMDKDVAIAVTMKKAIEEFFMVAPVELRVVSVYVKSLMPDEKEYENL